MLGSGYWPSNSLAYKQPAGDLDEARAGEEPTDGSMDGDGEGDGKRIKTNVLIDRLAGSDGLIDSLVATRLVSRGLNSRATLALAEPNADGRGGLSWPFVCFGAADELASTSPGGGEPRDAMRSGRCNWSTLLAAACTGASPGYLVCLPAADADAHEVRCGTSQQRGLALNEARPNRGAAAV
jgi:hypothetical protein